MEIVGWQLGWDFFQFFFQNCVKNEKIKHQLSNYLYTYIKSRPKIVAKHRILNIIIRLATIRTFAWPPLEQIIFHKVEKLEKMFYQFPTHLFKKT